jgi:hypothetical protein
MIILVLLRLRERMGSRTNGDDTFHCRIEMPIYTEGPTSIFAHTRAHSDTHTKDHSSSIMQVMPV